MHNTEYHITPHKDYLKEAKAFFSVYDLVDIILPFGQDHSKLKPKQQRTCMFCNKSFPEVKFNKKAHLISESLGNKDFLSDFECDNCNEYFDKNFENDLANYLGISRTITGLKGKNGIPGFTSPGKTIKAKQHKTAGDTAIIISRDDAENGAMKVNETNGALTITSVKNSFVPINVYRIFLKIALSLLEEKTVKEEYQLAIDFLMAKANTMKLKGCIVTGYQLPFTYNFPFHGYLSKKKNNADLLNSYVMTFYFQNIIFSIPLPLNKNDLFLYNRGELLKVPPFPPMFTQFTDIKDLKLQYFEDDFCSEEKVKGLKDEIIMTPHPEEFANMVAYDPVSKKFMPKEYKPAEIVKVIVFRTNETFDENQLGNLLNP